MPLLHGGGALVCSSTISEMTAPLIDTRGEFKVGSFDVKDEHWVHWSLKFEVGWKDAMSTAAMHAWDGSFSARH